MLEWRAERAVRAQRVSIAIGWGGVWPTRLGGLKGAVHGGYVAVSSGSFASRCSLDPARTPQVTQGVNEVNDRVTQQVFRERSERNVGSPSPRNEQRE